MNLKLCHAHAALVLLSSSLATIEYGWATSNCPDEVTVGHVAFKYLGQGRFMCGPSNPAYGSLERCTDLEDTLSLEASPRGLDQDERQRAVAWAKCHVAAHKGSSAQANANGAAQKAKQIPNCPPTLPPSCVTWSRYDQQLQWWNLTNNCGRDVSVTFRSEGTLENTQTFGNGESYRTKWQGTNPPNQVVWDAVKGSGFYRDKPAGAALKCRASLPL